MLVAEPELSLSPPNAESATGKVIGIDASTEMITRAQAKAAKAAIDVDFRAAAAEALPFSDERFDAVLSTTVLHCLPDAARRLCIREMIRVLKPGGRRLWRAGAR